jgi:hypothetical protein
MSDWTVDTLREHITTVLEEMNSRYEQRFLDSKTALDIAFTAQKELVASALGAADKAVIKAEVAAEKRFDSVNEFRALVSDQQRTLMPRSEAEIVFRSLSEKIDALRLSERGEKGKSEGTKEGSSSIIGLVGLITSLIAIGIILLKK